jgi:hypothetical protein
MNTNFSISKTALVSLVDAFLPRDDGTEPWGPGTPVILNWLSWILLNPQPLPPKIGPSPDPWLAGPVPDPWNRGAGLQPDPWRSFALVRLVTERAISHYQFAELTLNTGQLEKATDVVGMQIHRFVDEFCGTWPPRFPWPWPRKFDPRELHPVDFIVAGAEFQKASDTVAENQLKNHLSAAAERLFEMGLNKLEEQNTSRLTG